MKIGIIGYGQMGSGAAYNLNKNMIYLYMTNLKVIVIVLNHFVRLRKFFLIVR